MSSESNVYEEWDLIHLQSETYFVDTNKNDTLDTWDYVHEVTTTINDDVVDGSRNGWVSEDWGRPLNDLAKVRITVEEATVTRVKRNSDNEEE